MEATEEKPHLSVVIPAYNEEKRIPRTLDEVVNYLAKQNFTSEILVVDDGSKDETVNLVKEKASSIKLDNILRYEVIQYPDKANRGKGYAVRFGMLEARGNFRLFMDADNSTTIDHFDRLSVFLRQGYDIVIGSRHLKTSDVAVHQAWYKEIAGDLGNILIRSLAVPGIYDTQAGFKILTARASEDIFPKLTIDRWGFDIEMLAVGLHLHYKIKEAPITWINDPNSKVSAKAYLEVLGEVFRIRRNLRKGVYDK